MITTQLEHENKAISDVRGFSAAHPKASAKEKPEMDDGFILIVEDNRLIAHLLSRKLTKRGHHVVTAADERQFWKHAFHPKLQLILLDICLKNRMGTDIYKSLLDFGLDENIPVIFTTGMDHEFSSIGVMRSRNYAYIPKPIDFTKLYELIDYFLNRNDIEQIWAV